MHRVQRFAEIVEILKSLPSVRGVRISVRSELFGIDWARSGDCHQESYIGVVSQWKKKAGVCGCF